MKRFNRALIKVKVRTQEVKSGRPQRTRASMGSWWKVFIKQRQGEGLGWSLACDAGGVTAEVAHPCPHFPGSDFFFWLSQNCHGNLGDRVVLKPKC